QTNSTPARWVAEQKIEPSEHIKAGQELGIFHMGSTVICCWPKQAGLDLTAEIGKDVLLGQSARGSAAGG
ncbi:MAG: phosphatidylserine decarboxylase, partial [Bdellovibrionales bacterium]|nr:phosphatidylserine decarboxylase [Bdellovibrionales bacterium]